MMEALNIDHREKTWMFENIVSKLAKKTDQLPNIGMNTKYDNIHENHQAHNFFNIMIRSFLWKEERSL